MTNTESKVLNGVEWVYHFKDVPKDAIQPQRLAPPLYIAHYKCGRCRHEWSSVENMPPLNEIPCIMQSCRAPAFSLLITLLRHLKKEPVSGVGKLTRVEVECWK